MAAGKTDCSRGCSARRILGQIDVNGTVSLARVEARRNTSSVAGGWGRDSREETLCVLVLLQTGAGHAQRTECERPRVKFNEADSFASSRNGSAVGLCSGRRVRAVDCRRRKGKFWMEAVEE